MKATTTTSRSSRLRRQSGTAILVFWLSLFFAPAANGQTASTFGIFAGGGISFEAGNAGNPAKTIAGGYGGLLQFRQFFSKKLALETGIGFQRRNLNMAPNITVHDSTSYSVIDVVYHYNFLTIPLQLSYQLREGKDSKLFLGAGFRYGFLLKATDDVSWTNIDSTSFGVRENTSKFEYKKKVGLMQSDSKPIGSYLFNVATELHFTWQWRKHLALRAFYDYSLYDVNANATGGRRQHLHYAGLMVGYTLR